MVGAKDFKEGNIKTVHVGFYFAKETESEHFVTVAKNMGLVIEKVNTRKLAGGGDTIYEVLVSKKMKINSNAFDELADNLLDASEADGGQFQTMSR